MICTTSVTDYRMFSFCIIWTKMKKEKSKKKKKNNTKRLQLQEKTTKNKNKKWNEATMKSRTSGYCKYFPDRFSLGRIDPY